MTDTDHLDEEYVRYLIQDLKVFGAHKEGPTEVGEDTMQDALRILKLLRDDAARLDAASDLAEDFDRVMRDDLMNADDLYVECKSSYRWYRRVTGGGDGE